MNDATSPLLHDVMSRRNQTWRDLFPLFGAEAICSVAGTLLSIGTSFYMKERFGWEMKQNFLLTAGQGLIYVPGALLAGWIVKRIGRGVTICGAYAILTALALMAWHLSRVESSKAAMGVAALLLAYTFVIGISWPVLEGMIASGSARGLGRRLAAYNIIWPLAGAVAIAVEGTIISFWRQGVFLIPAAMHLSALMMMLPLRREADEPPSTAAPPDMHPEPELLHKRKLALWMSRTALPATYAVIYGLMPLMPYLQAIRVLDTARQTAVASVWLWARLLAFAVLATGSWWHTRPRLLLWAALLMLLSFFGMTLPPTHGSSPVIDLASMVFWQIVFGGALGMIYSASLYFGMVLSEGSTEHGGYHEALIGLGWVLGPAAGVAGMSIRPGETWAGVAAVGSIIAVSVVIVVVTAAIIGREREQSGTLSDAH